MPASQLRRLKASLREQGITGQQKAKKTKRHHAPDGGARDQRAKREAALTQIRDAFNPFEVQSSSRPRKFDITTNKSAKGMALGHRPGITKSHGEQTRRKSLLPELHRRNKVGGILDRRIGENDPHMTPEERAELRFARTGGRTRLGTFDLEDDGEDVLTHLGKSLAEGDGDDFDEHISQASSDLEDEGLGLKRKRPTAEESGQAMEIDGREQPDRKKSKAEVMQEVIAKSKLHKHERQQAREDDEDLREELDRGMGDLMAALQSHSTRRPTTVTSPPVDVEASINPDRLALLNGADRAVLDKEYDSRIKQMTMDKRAQPTDRSKTDDEKAKEREAHLQEVEENRLKRMHGEATEDPDTTELYHTNGVDDEEDLDDARAFGFTSGKQATEEQAVLDVEDEDDFIIDSNLVASGSDLDGSDTNSTDESDSNSHVDTGEPDYNEDEDDEFISGLLPKGPNASHCQHQLTLDGREATGVLAHTLTCPRSHHQLVEVLGRVPENDLPLAIQQIRASHDPKAAAENKAKLADFAAALVSHIVYLGDAEPPTRLSTIETVIRHVHSLSRTFADNVSVAFQHELRTLANSKLSPGRLCLLTAISTIYPTSDHFHQVVTPAITLMARWLGLTNPKTAHDLANGAYLSALCLSYQQLSKRYVPELLRFIHRALCHPDISPDLISAHLVNLDAAIDLWTQKGAFGEIFSTVVLPLKQCQHTAAPATLRKLEHLLQQAKRSRRPLELHQHRPLPIKTAVPLFEDNFNPDKHYDPNFERSEANKLKNEYKRERKGALRELRKDANFVSRERLREKKERDRAHEERERRIIAEINAEGGQERNEYEREKKRRKAR